MNIYDALRTEIITAIETGIIAGRLKDTLLFKYEATGQGIDCFTNEERALIEAELSRTDLYDSFSTEIDKRINRIEKKVDMIIYQIAALLNKPNTPPNLSSKEFQELMEHIDRDEKPLVQTTAERQMRFE
jgi:hypothetical protein